MQNLVQLFAVAACEAPGRPREPRPPAELACRIAAEVSQSRIEPRRYIGWQRLHVRCLVRCVVISKTVESEKLHGAKRRGKDRTVGPSLRPFVQEREIPFREDRPAAAIKELLQFRGVERDAFLIIAE